MPIDNIVGFDPKQPKFTELKLGKNGLDAIRVAVWNVGRQKLNGINPDQDHVSVLYPGPVLGWKKVETDTGMIYVASIWTNGGKPSSAAELLQYLLNYADRSS